MDNSPEEFQCNYKCNKDPLEQIYPSQNMCTLLASIPKGLRNLPYGMYPNCDIYYTNRFSYNKRWNWFPNVIFTPSTTKEVQYVFGEILTHKLPFFIRSGGHCYEQVIPSGYIIDLRNFNEIIPDTENSTVYLGSGCRSGDATIALGKIDYAIPTGTCPSTGITGVALGGGIGFLERRFGLTLDSVISMKVITADNKIITVSKDHHRDLFWAMRGAGHNSYGIVLGMTLKMYHIPKVTVLELRFDWDPRKFSEIYHAWQEWALALPPTVTTESVFKYKDGRVRLSVNALKMDDGHLDWEKVFKKFKPSSVVYEQGIRYVEAAKITASNYTFPFSKTKSKMLFKPLPQGGVDAIIRWMERLINEQCVYEAFWGIGMGPKPLSKTDSAFFPDAIGYAIGFIYFPQESQTEAALESIRQSYRELEPFTSPYSYGNLVDYDLGPTYLHAYYGTHVNRLIQIKQKHDPGDVFHWRQGIPTTNPCLDEG